MRGPRSAPARRAVDAYAGAPKGDRFHVAMRWWTCPFPELEAVVPTAGRVLEVGCGHGLLSLYLAAAAPGRDVTGADIDVDKLEVARVAATRFARGSEGAESPLVHFEKVAPDGFVDGEFDAIVIADVLYLLPAADRTELLDRCVDHLAPGGVLVVKEADRRPRWKASVTVAQELLSTKVLRITEGEQVEFAPPERLADHLRSRGLDVELRRVDQGYVHPHVLLVGRPAAAAAGTDTDPGASSPVAAPEHAPEPNTTGQPDDRYFDVMADAAQNHWWYRTRRAWIRQLLDARVVKGEVAIDAGTGTAEVLDVLRELGASTAVGTDFSLLALRHARKRTPPPLVARSLAEALPFADGSAATLVSLEVIEHLDDDLTALAEYRRVLRPDGILLITVPAYQWLWGDHDVTAAHRRRYGARQFRNVVEAAGFEVLEATSYFSFLVPPAFLVRRTPIGRLVGASEDEASSIHPVVDRLFEAMGAAERRVARSRAIPFGLSLAIVARRPHPR